MKTKSLIFSLFLLIPTIAYCQSNNTMVLKGSWMGPVITSQFSMNVPIKFELPENSLKGFLSVPARD